MAWEPLTPLLEIGSKLIDKLIPDPAAKAKAQLDLLVLQQNGELEELKTRMSAILAEAQSTDPWTSRARPAMLWVFYLIIISALPMGVIAAISADTAARIAAGFGAWLSAIPSSITDMGTFVLLGYTGARTIEKVRGVAK